MKRFAAIAGLALALAAPAARAQGCSMCADSARNAASGGQKAISRAVTVLLVPPVLMMAGLVGLAIRYRNQHERWDRD